MTMETYAALMVILLCWVMLLVTDLAVSGVLRLVAKVPLRKAFRWGLVALLVPPVVVAYGTIIERNRFEVKEVVLEFDDLPQSFDGYRIVHISDIHARSFVKSKFSTNNFKKIRIPQFSETRFGSFVGLFLVYKQ